MMSLLKQHWANVSIHYKAVTLCCTFVVPILVVVGILIFEFSVYRMETDRILSEYADCIDYANALRTESKLLDTLPFATMDSKTIGEYKDACDNTTSAWKLLAHAQEANGVQIDLLKQVIDRAMGRLRMQQDQFLVDFSAGGFDANAFSHLQQQSSYLIEYADQLMNAVLLEGRNRYLDLGQRVADQNIMLSIVAALGCIVFALLVLIIIRSLIQPVRQISYAARRVADGEYNTADFCYPASDEIGVLAASFNHMKHQIAHTIHALESEAALEKTLRQQEAEAARLRQLVEESRFAQLQSQINPHFLFNTLQSVASMAQIECATVTGDMVVRLANFFRYTLETDESMVPLERELALLRDYISLQELRFGERISFEMDCDSQSNTVYVPKFILQPLVENAIVHGMRNRNEGGRIRIVTSIDSVCCRIQVTDNGSGFTYTGDTSSATGRRSIGLHNISSRVQLMGGMFRLYSLPRLGTTARLLLPIQRRIIDDQNPDCRG